MTESDRYGVIGHPVSHSRSPMIHGLFARQLHQNMRYELIDAAPERFEAVVRQFAADGGLGLNVTVPHKQAAWRLAEEYGIEAAEAQAVNTLSFRPDGRIRGDNTDGVGFLRDLTQNLGEAVAGRAVLILGAGGATRGIVGPLLRAQVERLVIANRTESRARELGEGFDHGGRLSVCTFAALTTGQRFDLIVNATSVGLQGDTVPFPPACLDAGSFCYDLSYSPTRRTPFVDWALANGVRGAEQGWGMLVEQAAESFYLWRGLRPDTAALLEQGRR
jgi:shikimate dehydrogenase